MARGGANDMGVGGAGMKLLLSFVKERRSAVVLLFLFLHTLVTWLPQLSPPGFVPLDPIPSLFPTFARRSGSPAIFFSAPHFGGLL